MRVSSSIRCAVALLCLGTLLHCCLSGEVAAYPGPKEAGSAQKGPKGPNAGGPAGNIDWPRAKALHERASRGEKLSADD